MKTALDTNILSAIWSREPSAPRIVSALDRANGSGSLVVSLPAYAECFAHPFVSEAQIESFLAEVGIHIDSRLVEDVWIEAGRRYRQYAVHRRKSGSEPPRRILADFLIGAHALLQTDCLMTLDEQHYRNYFPELLLYRIGE
jgi:predicted nucleic acid-binding protein